MRKEDGRKERGKEGRNVVGKEEGMEARRKERKKVSSK